MLTKHELSRFVPCRNYIYKKELPRNFVESSQYSEDRGKIKKWLVSSLIKQAFSGQPDSVIRPIRKIIQATHETFPLNEIIQEFIGKPKDIVVSDEYLDNLFDYNYGNKYVFTILSILYPHLDFRNYFDIDHIHPKSLFNRKKLLEKGVPEEKIEFYLENHNTLANLQLLEGTPNKEKSSKEFKEWILENYPNELHQRDYFEKNFIPEVDLDLSNFEEFIEKRTALMNRKLRNLLQL